MEKKQQKPTELEHLPIFMPGVSDITPVIDKEVIKKIRNRIKTLTRYPKSGFPGCQPVSLNQSNIRHLKKPYMVSWKADGTRYVYELFHTSS